MFDLLRSERAKRGGKGESCFEVWRKRKDAKLEASKTRRVLKFILSFSSFDCSGSQLQSLSIMT